MVLGYEVLDTIAKYQNEIAVAIGGLACVVVGCLVYRDQKLRREIISNIKSRRKAKNLEDIY